MSKIIDEGQKPLNSSRRQMTRKDFLRGTKGMRGVGDDYTKKYGFYREGRFLRFGLPYYTKMVLVRDGLNIDFVPHNVSKAQYLEICEERLKEAEKQESEDAAE